MTTAPAPTTVLSPMLTPGQTMAPPPVPQGAAPSLYEQSVLLVNQKTKIIELTNEYAVLDGQGNQSGEHSPGDQHGGPAGP